MSYCQDTSEPPTPPPVEAGAVLRAEIARLRGDVEAYRECLINAESNETQLKADLARVTRERDEAQRRLAEEFANMDATMKGWDALCERSEVDEARIAELEATARTTGEQAAEGLKALARVVAEASRQGGLGEHAGPLFAALEQARTTLAALRAATTGQEAGR